MPSHVSIAITEIIFHAWFINFLGQMTFYIEPNDFAIRSPASGLLCCINHHLYYVHVNAMNEYTVLCFLLASFYVGDILFRDKKYGA